MKAGTASRVLVGIFASIIAILALMSLSGDDEVRSILRQTVVAAAVLGGIFYLSYRYKIAPRRAMFTDQAGRLGLTIVAGDPLGLLGSRFEVVRRRASVRDVETTATGTWEGHDVAVVDYWYAPTDQLQVDDSVRFVCALLPVPATWPRLLVVPERIAWLLELPTHTGFEVRDGRLLCFVDRQLDGDVEHALRTARAFLERVPGAARAWYG
jgi:hypothetical protein